MRLAGLASIDGGDELEALVIAEAADLFLARDWGRVACANRIGSLMDKDTLDAAQEDLEEIRATHKPEAEIEDRTEGQGRGGEGQTQSERVRESQGEGRLSSVKAAEH